MTGDFTGIASGITGGPNITAGLVTATKFQGNTPGSSTGVSGGKNINVGTFTASSFAGDLTGNAAGLSTTTAKLKIGITSATSFAGYITGIAFKLSSIKPSTLKSSKLDKDLTELIELVVDEIYKLNEIIRSLNTDSAKSIELAQDTQKIER